MCYYRMGYENQRKAKNLTKKDLSRLIDFISHQKIQMTLWLCEWQWDFIWRSLTVIRKVGRKTLEIDEIITRKKQVSPDKNCVTKKKKE